MSRPFTFVADAVAGVAVVGAWTQYLPTAAALVGVVWYGIQIIESETAWRAYKWFVSLIKRDKI